MRLRCDPILRRVLATVAVVLLLLAIYIVAQALTMFLVEQGLYLARQMNPRIPV
jgi:hypothetical protein